MLYPLVATTYIMAVTSVHHTVIILLLPLKHTSKTLDPFPPFPTLSSNIKYTMAIKEINYWQC